MMGVHGEILTGTEIAIGGRRKIPEVIAEYEDKRGQIPAVLAEFERAGKIVNRAASIGGTFSNIQVNTGSIRRQELEKSLLCSAWRHVYASLQLEQYATATDKKRFEQMFAAPPPFTLENILDQFGDVASDPRSTILRGLAEAFSDLDPAFKSHEKMKIGIKGMPKRVILPNVTEYGWGKERLQNILNALAAYQGKQLVSHNDMSAIMADGEALRNGGEFIRAYERQRIERGQLKEEDAEKHDLVGRDVWLKGYANGNGHLYFGPEALRDINRALAEYYGDVLPDCPEERPAKQRTGTAVSKDLQYYPTPKAVVNRIIADLYQLSGKRVLEPSCGCGRFMDALRSAGANVFGIEYNTGRVEQCKGKGHNVLRANFLQTAPTGDFDRVVMNPPFYGRHYAKHVRHALKFLKPGGVLTAILPATARYEHGELDNLNPRWSDLPTGSFSESGTNIHTTVATIEKAE